jgi:precorrin-8X/cobalt-precorrin-8 methylmutase
MALFDAYIVVDWSAASRPRHGKDSIWWALVRRINGEVGMVRRENPRTRHAATQGLANQLAELLAEGARTLIGFDFPFGYPDGTAARLGLPGLPWRHMWQDIADALDDAPDNSNNRFDLAENLNERLYGEAFPFWGNVREEDRPYLRRRGRRPHTDGDLAEWRACDRLGKTTSSVWQLVGNGSVGSQVLTGVSRVLQLRTDPRLAMDSLIWPFETGLAHDPRAKIIFAEVYPSLLAPKPEPDQVKDARQVRTTAEYFATLDATGDLEPFFAGDPDLTPAEREAIVGEEAWILGVTRNNERPERRPPTKRRRYDYERNPVEIYQTSFEIVRREANLDDVPVDLSDVARRLVHATGTPDIIDALVASPGAATIGCEALRNGAPILCDVEMVAHGITRTSLPNCNDVICTLNDPQTHDHAAALGTTRSAAAIDFWTPWQEGAVIAIGNAPTALFHLLERLDEGAPKPALILGFPVGFVGAAESKAALIDNPFGVPYIALKGRRGGSAMAAAAVNALALLARDEDAPLKVKSGNKTPWLNIIGVGEGGYWALSPTARALIDAAEICYGGARHLAMLPPSYPGAQRRWKTPLRHSFSDIKALEGRQTVVLATGDPMNFGIGATLVREFGDAFGVDTLAILPAPGAFSLAAARMRWALPETICLSIHGRPLAVLNLHIAPGAKLLILSENENSPAAVASLLCDRGFGDSTLNVLEHLGGAREIVRQSTAKAFDATAKPLRLNTIAVECVAGPDAQFYSRSGGLPDDAFEHDGQLTKQVVRAATLAALGPRPGAHLWDIGAGCGSISVEWMRAGGCATAVERNPDRLAMIARNATSLGVPALEIVAGTALDVLPNLNAPDAVFVGGGLSNDGLLANCYDALAPSGRLVANAVTVEGEATLARAYEAWGGSLTRIAISKVRPIGRLHGWDTAMPVTQFTVTKS